MVLKDLEIIKSGRKVLFIVWFFTLWGIVTYALFERFGYARGTYGFGPGLLFLLWTAISFSLLVVTGGPLYLYFRRKELHTTGTAILTVVFIASTITLANSLVQPALISAGNKSKVQSYIDDGKHSLACACFLD